MGDNNIMEQSRFVGIFKLAEQTTEASIFMFVVLTQKKS